MIIASSVLAFLPAVILAVSQKEAPVETVLWRWDETTKSAAETARFDPFKGKAPGSLFAQDLGSDGTHEVIAGAGAGRKPTVKILRADGSVISEFPAYDDKMLRGVRVAAGDLDGDGIAEIVTVPGPGAVAHVVVRNSAGEMKFIAGGFYPYGDAYKGGASVAVGDLDGDGRDEIVTGAGPGGKPQVKTWRSNGAMIGEFSAFDGKSLGGINVAAGDLDGDGRAEIIAAMAGGAPAIVQIFDGLTLLKIREFTVIDDFTGGLHLAAGDADGDGRIEIVTGTNGGTPEVGVFDAAGNAKIRFLAYPQDYRGGVRVAVGRFLGGGLAAVGGGTAVTHLITAPADMGELVRPELAKYITVDISEQRLRAYEYGREVKTFLVSTGTVRYPTPLGEHSVLEKKPYVRYQWSYGPKDPDNYDFGFVPWNLLIYPHIYIHYAYWHNDFGRRRSHGCVNVNLENAKWIYNWAEVGTPVTVQP